MGTYESTYVTIKGVDDSYSWQLYKSDSETGNGNVVYNYTEDKRYGDIYLYFDYMIPDDTGYYYLVVSTPERTKRI